MGSPDKILSILVLTICTIAILALLAGFLIPSFDSSKTLLVGTILGALVPLAATLAGIAWAKNLDIKRNGSGKNGEK